MIKLPVSNFDLMLEDYEAYDTDRVPFVVLVTIAKGGRYLVLAAVTLAWL